ncbi:hypothetical protein HOM56_03555 [Candidatus Woesearchaeota archaeon]|jgi:large subunit ribosomal protein L32e|nr:hypothetical protein [Candidatus Woesearchaeota archaeon]
MKELLDLRNKAKAKKPTFLKQGANTMVRLRNHWRQPKGQHSKIRKKLRSYMRQPSMGFSSPKEVRGLTRDGHEIILINTLSELEGIKTPISIGATVGKRKRMIIIQECKKNNIQILNIKDVESYTKAIEDSLKSNKQRIQQRKDKRAKEEAKKKAAEKKKDEKDKPKEKAPVEKQEAQVKEEKKKILEKKE